jgi:hypothetical protein
MKRAALAVTALVLVGCASAGQPPACAPGLMPMILADLFFGRDIAGRAMVSEEEWQGFLDEEVTPRFPSGLSAADLSGQYRNNAGRIVRERTKELLIFMPGGSDSDAKLGAIRGAYKRRFNQESVLLSETLLCAGF